MFQLNINATAVVHQTVRLERLHRSALPVAIRTALNNTAFDLKSNAMPAVAKQTFIERSPNFFRANSRVKKATGFNISSMKAEVGFVSKGGNDRSVDDLQEQESGGNLKRSLIALKRARNGSAWNKRVKAKMKISTIKGKIVDPGSAGSRNNRNDRQAFTKSAAFAGKGGLLRGTGLNRDIVFEIKKLKRVKGNLIVKAVPVFSIDRGRDVRIKKTGFMEKASNQSLRLMEAFYERAARTQINRLR